MIVCPACSSRTPQGSVFCPKCGRELPPGSVDPTRTSAGSPERASTSPLEGRFLPGVVIAGRYRIHGLLGRGGMGEVYRADDLKLGQSVALKFLPRDVETDEARRSRFLNEVKVARQISHANVCRVYDVGDVEGRHFLSMEYVDGEDLAALLRRIGRIPREKATQIARQLCAGLAAAHEQGVLHRDLKPANVMIDGRGRAKITDFGLAVLAGDVAREEIGAGTPVYMAPEQLAGRPATVKSDLYALGLVLYELFTGRRPFAASSTDELAQLQRESTPASPSSHVEGFDPAVERVILRCLRSDPNDRPASALGVAAALPGGDPLAAALAAGETPSPELVAEAGDVGGWSLGAASACAAALVVGIVLVVALSGRTQLKRLVPLEKPPEALTDRAQTILSELGYDEAPVDTVRGFSADESYVSFVVEHDRSPGRWDRLTKVRPPAVRFWYRQGARPILPIDRMTRYPTHDDPPATEPGTVSVDLDPQGRLERLVAALPERDEGSSAAPDPDWSVALRAAGLDAGSLKPIEPQWTPPVGADRRAAWEGTCPGDPSVPIRIEAAAYRGRPVFFRVIYPWTTPEEMAGAGSNVLLRISAAMLSVLMLVVILAAAFIARRNVRLGRGDRKGALRLATFVFALGGVASLLAGHYVASVATIPHTIWANALPLLIAATVWVFYLAMEPYLRRIWPQTIVSWVRLLDGRLRDPLVARDVFVGLVLGVGLRLLDQSFQLLCERLGRASGITDMFAGPPIEVALTGLIDLRHALSTLLICVGAALVLPLATVLLLLLFRILSRRDWIAILVWVVVADVTAIPPGFDPLALIVWSTIGGAIFLLALFRFGLLTVCAATLTSIWLTVFPLTFAASSWYFSRTLLVLIALGTIAWFGFRVSILGSQARRVALGAGAASKGP
jgi:serine/threonine-protein kinase